MLMNEYQRLALRTMNVSERREALSLGALGLSGESGEVTDLVKKFLFHGHPLDAEKVKKELGDVLWYLAVLADTCSIPLSDVATANIDKLRARYPDGFSEEASKNRKPEGGSLKTDSCSHSDAVRDGGGYKCKACGFHLGYGPTPSDSGERGGGYDNLPPHDLTIGCVHRSTIQDSRRICINCGSIVNNREPLDRSKTTAIGNIEIVETPGDFCGNTGVMSNGQKCPGCRACR